jgi:hypothetical protein
MLATAFVRTAAVFFPWPAARPHNTKHPVRLALVHKPGLQAPRSSVRGACSRRGMLLALLTTREPAARSPRSSPLRLPLQTRGCLVGS